MAQQVRIAGATYADVPSISVPDASNNWHSFTDVSDTTATASDVMSGKQFYNSSGTLTQGTATGSTYTEELNAAGGLTVTITG